MNKNIEQDKICGSLVGGAVGDAFCYPVEFIGSYMGIKQRYGEKGITRLDTTQWWLPDGGRNHNAWEYFLNGYLKYEDDHIAGHITNDSFWKSYNTLGAGVAYKPCIVRGGIRHGLNNYGTLRLGGSVGSDCHEVVGWVNVGYEHNYALRNGWYLYWQLKKDLCINGKDLFRTGVTIGVKLPYNAR